MSHAISGNNALIMADVLERAYRLALGLEGVTRKQSLKTNPTSAMTSKLFSDRKIQTECK